MIELLRASPQGLFASATLTGHLLRGAAAFALLHEAIVLQDASPWTALGLGLLALVAMRGCPICWTIGLLETLLERRRARVGQAR